MEVSRPNVSYYCLMNVFLEKHFMTYYSNFSFNPQNTRSTLWSISLKSINVLEAIGFVSSNKRTNRNMKLFWIIWWRVRSCTCFIRYIYFRLAFLSTDVQKCSNRFNAKISPENLVRILTSLNCVIHTLYYSDCFVWERGD